MRFNRTHFANTNIPTQTPYSPSELAPPPIADQWTQQNVIERSKRNVTTSTPYANTVSPPREWTHDLPASSPIATPTPYFADLRIIRMVLQVVPEKRATPSVEKMPSARKECKLPSRKELTCMKFGISGKSQNGFSFIQSDSSSRTNLYVRNRSGGASPTRYRMGQKQSRSYD